MQQHGEGDAISNDGAPKGDQEEDNIQHDHQRIRKHFLRVQLRRA
jgi:hypothetical protein